MLTRLRVCCSSSIAREVRGTWICRVIGLHQLKGDLSGFWSVTISANWRIIFRFEAENVTDLDYIDYH